MTGRFITFEGGEGAGKSTQIERLKRRLSEASQKVIATREPGGSPRAEEIRSFILSGRAKPLGSFAEALLFSAARINHIDKTIVPALSSGTHVLCDRFADSTKAYQGAVGQVDSGLIDSLARIALKGLRPDVTFILDLPAEIGLSRAGQRQAGKGERADRFEQEDFAFHHALRDAFLAIARGAPERCVVIDASEDPDRVEGAIWSALSTRLPDLTQSETRAADVA
ncbi:dTMP kinase [Microvirga puerhi]|uniref:Thymidylate kinase n=1 Tax=Microvirga puerhi TaxID=2876078 RepID=A0ABS7VN55_9HYPH|nr:dTMP kinase [Microvirga puerhi]MBZ6076967.1 dTMP kinase [Microvirga puerhi]